MLHTTKHIVEESEENIHVRYLFTKVYTNKWVCVYKVLAIVYI